MNSMNSNSAGSGDFSIGSLIFYLLVAALFIYILKNFTRLRESVSKKANETINPKYAQYQKMKREGDEEEKESIPMQSLEKKAGEAKNYSNKIFKKKSKE
mmetsp:Transcript_38574/g.36926  ORF Transcript_38574/g.36926 Transcript_38574/m.36926 type:complete len:100 (+) Transcript_38574:7-306(+)